MKPPLLSGALTEYVGGRNGSLSTAVKGTTWVSGEENGSSPHRRECSPTKWHLSDTQGTYTLLWVTWRSLELSAVCFLSTSFNFHWISKSPFLPGTWVPLGIVSFSYKLRFGVSASALSEGKHGPMWLPWLPLAWSWGSQQASLCASNAPICHRLPPRLTQRSVGRPSAGGRVQRRLP